MVGNTPSLRGLFVPEILSCTLVRVIVSFGISSIAIRSDRPARRIHATLNSTIGSICRLQSTYSLVLYVTTYICR